jgi:hypothetical protein
LRLEVTTGLDTEQLTELVVRVRARLGGEYVSRSRPFALGLFRSVAMVLALLRQNIVQQVAAEVFGVSQSTVSRRWDALRGVIETVLAEFVLTPAEIAGASTVLVDGTLVPTWDWRHRSDLFSGKHHDTGFNLQVGPPWAVTSSRSAPRCPARVTTPTPGRPVAWPSCWPAWTTSPTLVTSGSARCSPGTRSHPAAS